MKKCVIFAFKGDPMCFIHVLLNANDMNEKGIECKIVMEGEAVTLLKDLEESKNPMYLKVRDAGYFECICRACSAKLGVLDFNETTGIPITGDMAGHPSMSRYLQAGYEIITM
ncbi:MAG: cytoplasmic protein [Clostridia bacterium]|nr:cytoplasmic protein [Clostridia bacterium]